MATLADFVTRLSNDIGCFFHWNNSDCYSLKKYNSMDQGSKGAFAWVHLRKRKNRFMIANAQELADKAKIGHLADETNEKSIWGNPGIHFYVTRGSHGTDYQKAVTALKAIMNLK